MSDAVAAEGETFLRLAHEWRLQLAGQALGSALDVVAARRIVADAEIAQRAAALALEAADRLLALTLLQPGPREQARLAHNERNRRNYHTRQRRSGHERRTNRPDLT